MERWIQCTACGAKIRADRPACPRCRTKFVPTPERDPVAEAMTKPQARDLVGRRAGRCRARRGCRLGREGIRAAHDHDGQARRSACRATCAAQRRPPPSQRRHRSKRPFLDEAGSGAAAYATGNYGSALEQFQAAVKKNPDDAESLSNLGQLLVRLGRTAEAIPYFERAIKIIPQRWAYRFNLARAQGLLGKWDDAIATYREAQQLFPNDYATTFNLALALHKKGDDAGAVAEYKKAIALDPNDASFRMALAISLEKLDRRSEAVAAYNDYLQLAPSAPDAEQVRARVAQLSGQATPSQPPPGGSSTSGV